LGRPFPSRSRSMLREWCTGLFPFSSSRRSILETECLSPSINPDGMMVRRTFSDLSALSISHLQRRKVKFTYSKERMRYFIHELTLDLRFSRDFVWGGTCLFEGSNFT